MITKFHTLYILTQLVALFTSALLGDEKTFCSVSKHFRNSLFAFIYFNLFHLFVFSCFLSIFLFIFLIPSFLFPYYFIPLHTNILSVFWSQIHNVFIFFIFLHFLLFFIFFIFFTSDLLQTLNNQVTIMTFWPTINLDVIKVSFV
jgi:hypothetical protein